MLSQPEQNYKYLVRFLATGDSYISLESLHRVGKSTIFPFKKEKRNFKKKRNFKFPLLFT